MWSVPVNWLCFSCCLPLNNYMNFSDIEGIYTYTFEAEKKVCVYCYVLVIVHYSFNLIFYSFLYNLYEIKLWFLAAIYVNNCLLRNQHAFSKCKCLQPCQAKNNILMPIFGSVVCCLTIHVNTIQTEGMIQILTMYILIKRAIYLVLIRRWDHCLKH